MGADMDAFVETLDASFWGRAGRDGVLPTVARRLLIDAGTLPRSRRPARSRRPCRWFRFSRSFASTALSAFGGGGGRLLSRHPSSTDPMTDWTVLSKPAHFSYLYRNAIPSLFVSGVGQPSSAPSHRLDPHFAALRILYQPLASLIGTGSSGHARQPETEVCVSHTSRVTTR